MNELSVEYAVSLPCTDCVEVVLTEWTDVVSGKFIKPIWGCIASKARSCVATTVVPPTEPVDVAGSPDSVIVYVSSVTLPILCVPLITLPCIPLKSVVAPKPDIVTLLGLLSFIPWPLWVIRIIFGLPPKAEPLPELLSVSIGLFSNVLLSTVSFVSCNVPVVPVVNTHLCKVNFKSSIWSSDHNEVFCDLKKEPNKGCVDILLVPPSLDTQTLYFWLSGFIIIAYSLPPWQYTGLGKVTVVALEASVDVLTELGFNITSLNGNIFWPGLLLIVSTR